MLSKQLMGHFLTIPLLLFILLGAFTVSAQTDSVYWSFGTSGTPTANATSSSYAGVPAAACLADTGNACCAFSSASGYSTLYFTTQFPSSGYPGASGEPTMRNNAKTGGFNVNTSTYFSFTVTPNTGTAVEIKEIHFAGLKNATGPGNYAIRTSLDGYSATVATSSFSSSYGSSKKTHTGLSLQGTSGTPITVRIYTYSPLVSSTGGNVFIDDVVIYYDATGSVTPASVSTGSLSSSLCVGASVTVPYTITGTFNSGNIFTAELSDATGSFSSPVNIGTLNSTGSGNINATIPSGTLTGTGYRIRVISSNPALTGTDNGSNITVNASAASSVTIAASATVICVGDPVTFTATVPTVNSGPTVPISGSSLTCTNSMIGTSSCVGAGGSYASGWGSGDYWQYQVNTTGYGNIVFNTPTSSSNTGPHNGDLWYSTNGTTFTHVAAYTWGSGTTCGSTGNIALPAAADNQPTLYVRLIMTGASGSSGTNRVNPNAFKGKVLQTSFTPIYQWKKNGSNVGTNSNTYIDNTLADNDDVWVEVSSNTCVNPAVATSNTITMKVNPLLTPSVSIAASANNVCAGSSVTITATPTNGGSAPGYQWKVNGGNVGTNSPTYTSSTLANNDIVTCVLTPASCASPATATSNSIAMVINPVLTPSVSIVSTSNAICAGTQVTFTASPTNGGASPSYQWKINGTTNVGTNSPTYSDNSLANGDVVTVVMTSNAGCISPATATSNGIAMTVSVPLTPSVAIAATPGNVICDGTPVTITATPTNGGSTPTYQWKKNNANVGSNSPTYNDNALINGDILTVVITSNAICLATPSGTSSGITMTVNPIIVPSVAVTVSPSHTICDGTMTTFTAQPNNEGTLPIYQWKKNNVVVGSAGTTYSDNMLVNGDKITFTMTSNATCATPATVTSTPDTMTVNPLLPTSVSVIISPNDTFCAGTPVTFQAKFTNGGITPTFQWKKNNINVGNTNSSYNDNGLADGDLISVTMTSDAVCATPAIISSQVPVAVTVRPVFHPSVTLVAKPGTVLANDEMVYFTAYITDAGANPKIHWEINGVTIPGIKTDNYFSRILNNNDTITCIVESIDSCSIGNIGVSNKLIMSIGTGIKNVGNVFTNISLYPNPNTGIFTVQGEINTYKDVKIEVMTTLGQVVYTSTLPVTGKRINQQIAMPEIARGTYLMRVQAEDEQKVLRFVVQ